MCTLVANEEQKPLSWFETAAKMLVSTSFHLSPFIHCALISSSGNDESDNNTDYESNAQQGRQKFKQFPN